MITEAAVANRHKRLLVVDDDPEDMLLVKAAVKRSRLPILVDCYRGGEEFLEALDKMADAVSMDPGERSNCIVFLDLNMPRKDGRSCLREIRGDNRYATLPVIVFSTSASDDDIRKSYEMGANSYICKPDDVDNLERIITEVYRYWFFECH